MASGPVRGAGDNHRHPHKYLAMTPTCRNCRFFKAYRNDDLTPIDYGDCHRHPPVVLIRHMVEPADNEPGHNDRAAIEWPQVDAADFCGEHRMVDAALPN